MTTKQLINIINKHHTTQSEFCRLIKMDRYELQKLIAAATKKMTPERQAKILELARLAKKTKNVPLNALTKELCAKIKKAIEARDPVKKGCIQRFCEAEGFNVNSVWHILQGGRKTVSGTVSDILKVLKIKHP